MPRTRRMVQATEIGARVLKKIQPQQTLGASLAAPTIIVIDL